VPVSRSQVVIVGGGPVGLGLAIELGQRDISTVVIEKEASLHEIPKGQNLTQRTMEHFRSWEVEGQIRAARVMPPGYPAVGINAYGNLTSQYAHPWFRRSQVGRYYFAANERLPQYSTEAVLQERLRDLPAVTDIRGTEARAISQDDTKVVVSTDAGEFEADYLVGCDGSRSIVREQSGIAEERSRHERKMVLLVFRSRQLHTLLEERFGEAAFFNVLHPDLEGYWRFLGRVDVGEGWFFHAPVPPDATVESLDYQALLSATVGADFEVDLGYIGFWDLRIAVAETYQSGRVFIAGDAAHSHPPYGGYGINTGLEDVRNLGWKLAAELQGWGGNNLLESYTEERRPVFVSTARDFIERFIEGDRGFIDSHNPDVDQADFDAAWEQRRADSNAGVSGFAPHYEGSPLVDGPIGGTSSAVGSHDFTAQPGHHLAPSSIASTPDLFGALGAGFSLIASNTAGDAIDQFRKSAQELGIPLAIVLSEVDGELAGYETDLILVRPDHFISWVDNGSPFDAKDVLAMSIG